jgi:antitoxin (DNA-binding transcriptional repressor) of toxin-antitoxin stability system
MSGRYFTENSFSCVQQSTKIHRWRNPFPFPVPVPDEDPLAPVVDQAANGEPFVIAKAGKPWVKVVPLTAPEAGQLKRLGFLTGHIVVPDDSDHKTGSRSSGLQS